MRFLAGIVAAFLFAGGALADSVFVFEGERRRLPVEPTAFHPQESGRVLVEAGDAFYWLDEAELVAGDVAVAGPEQSAGGSLTQVSGDNQVVVSGSRFEISVRARNQAGAPTAGLNVAVTRVEPAGNLVFCLPGVTSTGGQVSLLCSASGVGEPVDVEITVGDALGRAASPFRVRIEPALVEEGLRSLSGSVIPTPQHRSFQFVVQAVDDGVAQAGLNLDVRANPGFPLLTCPTLFRTDVFGLATIVCGAHGVTGPVLSEVTVTDPDGRVLVVTVNVVPHETLNDGPHKVSGDNQELPRFGVAAASLIVSALDGGLPRAGAALTVTRSSGLVFCPSQVITNEAGLAPITCSAGNVGLESFIDVQVADEEGRELAVPFRLRVQPIDPGGASGLRLESEDEIEGVVGRPIAEEVLVTALDGDDMPAPGAPVFAWAAGGSVVFDPSVSVSDGKGEASIRVTPGCSARQEIINLGLSSKDVLETVSLSVLAGPPRIARKIRGDLQSGPAGRLLTDEALVVAITDICGTALRGVDVAWSVEPADAATLVNTISPTDASGHSSTLIQLGNVAGPFLVHARAGDLAATFNLSVTQVPSSVVSAGGDGQRIAVGMPSAEPLTVEVRDQDGGPIAGTPVGFSVDLGEATLGTTDLLTDENGRASVSLTAGQTLGRLLVTARAGTSIGSAGGVGQTPPFFTFVLEVVGASPSATPAGFVNGASFRTGWTPGAIGTVFGADLMEGLDGAIVAGPAPFPTLLQDVSVLVNGIAAPIVALADVNGQQQINVQVPFETAPGFASVELRNSGSSTVVEGVPVSAVHPGVFEVSDGDVRVAAALHADFTLVTRSNPARNGETILLFVTGLGELEQEVGTNVGGPIPPRRTAEMPVVGIDNEGMPVAGAFYAPGLVGTYQVNFVVGPDVAPGVRTLSVVSAGAASQPVGLPVGPAASAER